MEPALNIVEVLLETEPVDVEIVETMEVLERPSRNGQCGKEYPYAFDSGYRCCKNGFDDPTDLDGIWRNGFLNFDSKGCRGESQPCPLGCMNYQYQKYWCYAYDGIGTKNSKTLGSKTTTNTTWKECEEYAKDSKADGFLWYEDGVCRPKKGKKGNIALDFDKPSVHTMGLIPCP